MPSRSTAMPKRFEQLQRDLDVGLGDQLALDLDHRVDRLGAQRQRQQQGAQELAGDVAAHLERRGEARAARSRPRRAAADSLRCSRHSTPQPSARRASTRSPIGRSCMRGVPRSSKIGVGGRGEQGQRRRQRPHRGAGVAEEEGRALQRRPAAEAVHGEPVRRCLDAAAELHQRVDHDPGVVGIEHAVDHASCPRRSRRAAGRGWRCSSSRAPAPCRRRR